MKKFDTKSIVLGFAIGIIGVSIVFAVVEKKSAAINEKWDGGAPVAAENLVDSSTKNNDAVTTAEGIKSASISNDKVYFNGHEIELKKPLIKILNNESSEAQLYMPMDELLEYMHFKVEWNSKDNSVYLTMNDQNNQETTDVKPDISKSQADTKAIEIMQKTGNWGYIEPYIPHMSDGGIEKIVEIYNSKHINSSEHKKASDYIKN